MRHGQCPPIAPSAFNRRSAVFPWERWPRGSASCSLDDLDAIVGSQLFGNSGLVRTRILLAGTRAEFDRTLSDLAIRPHDGFAATGKLAEVFPFGAVDAEGVPFVIQPPEGAGQPMVAIARDLLDLEQSCLGKRPARSIAGPAFSHARPRI
jgi:hypothetical protein